MASTEPEASPTSATLPRHTALRQHDADLFGRDGRDVELATVAPVDLHVLAPRSRAVMAAKSEAAALVVAGIESGPSAHGRVAAIGAGDPPGAHQAVIGEHAVRGDTGNRAPPTQAGNGVGNLIYPPLV